MISTSVNYTAEVLNSWKEIAGYLNRGVRTVQRWEAELGLPVRRPRGKTQSPVLALRSDIDEWVRSRPLERRRSAEASTPLLTLLESETLGFLNAGMKFALSIAKISLQSRNNEVARGCLTTAQTAFQTALRFRDALPLDPPAAAVLDTNLKQFAAGLAGLERPVELEKAAAAANTGFHDSTKPAAPRAAHRDDSRAPSLQVEHKEETAGPTLGPARRVS